MRISDSAHRHGVDDDDIRHALRNAIRTIDGDVEIVVGSDRTGRLLEIGVVVRGDETAVIHAMPARAKFLR